MHLRYRPDSKHAVKDTVYIDNRLALSTKAVSALENATVKLHKCSDLHPKWKTSSMSYVRKSIQTRSMYPDILSNP